MGRRKSRDSVSQRQQDPLTSYNQVGSLESALPSRIAAAVSVVSLLLGTVAITPWGNSLQAIVPGRLTLAGLEMPFLALGAMVILLITWWLYKRRPKRCQFCRRSLQTVVRPLILRNELLARPGLVIDGSYYSLVGRLPAGRKWMKLHQLSNVCHHCRIYETRHFKRYEPLNEREQKALRAELDKQIIS